MARPREFDEQQVLMQARDAFWAKGYAGTSVNDLTAATGLGKGSLYGAFGDKHALFARVFDDYCVAVRQGAVHDLSGPDDTALERLEAYVRDLALDSVTRLGDDGLPLTERSGRGCLLAKTTAELASQDHAVAERALETFRGIREQLTGAIDGAQRAGDLDPAVDATAQAGLLLATVRGFESLGKAGMTEPELVAIGEAAVAAMPRPR